jgi:hypothetical protein
MNEETNSGTAASTGGHPQGFESYADGFGRIPLKVVPRRDARHAPHGLGLLPCSRRTLTVWVRELPPGRRLKTEGTRHTRWTRPQWLANFLAGQSGKV